MTDITQPYADGAPASLVPGPEGHPRSSAVEYVEAMPGDLGTDAIVSAIRAFGGSWHDVEVHPQISSTNAAGLARASAGAGAGTILVADVQTSGRGRLDRSWA
ncbi:MAG: hypothetical protein WCF04_08910, partial [Candidatus Nanopelagicales bacterium]